ncbi:MAG: MBL fold metallo-hydrolase [Bacteroidetes bacterium]|nr:MBL fold metallo-hydrolase [Bacteroidota bacterium]
MINIKVFAFNPFQENTYILFNDSGMAILIDPGYFFPGEKELLYQFIAEKKLRMVQLLNTHCHLDHIFGANDAFEKWGLPMYLHPQEEIVLERSPEAALMYGVKLTTFTGELIFIREGDLIRLGDDELQVLLTPGHSPGSICLYCEKQAFVISGDVLFLDSIGRSDLPGGDYETLLKSIKEKLFRLPDETVVYPGHGKETTIGYEKKNNPFLQGML